MERPTLNDRAHRLTRLLAASALACAFGSGFGRAAPAQDPDADDDEPAPAAAPVPQFRVADQNFDVGVFGNYRTADTARARLGQLCGLITDEVDRVCGLTSAQKDKLLLAARGDLNRYFGRVDEKRKEFQLARTDQRKYQEFYTSLAPLQRAIQNGLFGDGSLFSKALKTTLDPGQTARYEATLRERKSFHSRARFDLVVALMDNALGLTADQRGRVRALIRAETRPPRKHGYYDYQVLLIQLSRLPEGKLKPLFLEGQWRSLTAQFNNAQGMEAFLIKNDFLPDKTDPGYEPDPTPAEPTAPHAPEGPTR
jgi:hypothetical protein